MPWPLDTASLSHVTEGVPRSSAALAAQWRRRRREFRGALAPQWEKSGAAARDAGCRRWLGGELPGPAVELRQVIIDVDRANLDHEITVKYYFTDYLIPKLIEIIKILLFN